MLSPKNLHRPQWATRDPWAPMARPPGAYPPSPNPGSSPNGDVKTVVEAVKARKDEYVRKKTIKVKVGTWNVAALQDTYKDLGGWFADGLGIKGLSQDMSGLRMSGDGTDSDLDDSDVESVNKQESRVSKHNTTLPRHDSPAVPSGDEVDLYVLGLQEVIDVASVTEAMKPYTDPNPAKKWKKVLRKYLPGYKKVVEQQLIGLLLVVFASPALYPEISSVDSTSVGTGLMGYLGNKGAVSARILLGETTRILFVNCHLAAGADATALTRRIWDTQQIVSRTRFDPVGEECVSNTGHTEAIGDEDIAFWFGDLNYRLDDIPGEDVRRLLLLHARNEYDVQNASKRRIDSELGFLPQPKGQQLSSTRDESSEVERPATVSSAEPPLDPAQDPASLLTTLKSLLTHDQLHAQQRAKKAFHEGWREGDINFLPTYKYDVGSVAMFDSGEKKRSPSWCDRILYRSRLDHEKYSRKVRSDAEANKRDEEMKKRGLDDAASQEDVLFNYDPDADGDDYDDEVESHDNDPDAELVRTRSGFEDAVILDKYVSHQRVLSSDHKPLTAVFTVTYDSVDPALKAQVHQSVTREFDKAENEARPSVTLVLDHHSFATSVTDKSSEAPELKVVDLGDVRYHVLYEHHLTIANTGQMEVVYAFMNRPADGTEASSAGPTAPWLKLVVHQSEDKNKIGPQDLESTTRYRLSPGETTSIDLLVDITEVEMVRRLNAGDATLDDILVLRISGGRDFFIPVKGQWLETSFYRSIDELVRFPSGVRSLARTSDKIKGRKQPSRDVVNSAPRELFALTDKIPSLAERAVAEWEILHDENEPPWKITHAWPFDMHKSTTADVEIKAEQLAEVREALDTSSHLDEHLSPGTDPVEQLSLLAETLMSFLNSLLDGIITVEVWQVIESKLLILEKSKRLVTSDMLQDLAMEAMSTTPIHSVSLTFITFMLHRLINEVTADSVMDQQSATSAGRSRSSTSASAMSDVSLTSITSLEPVKTKGSFLNSLTRRSTNSGVSITPVSSTTTEVNTLPGRKSQLAHVYATVFAPMIIRSEETKLKAKEQRVQLERKVRVLEAFLNQPP